MQPYFNPTKRKMEDDLIFLKMQNELHFFENGKQPQV
jgi:hypothetical protein